LFEREREHERGKSRERGRARESQADSPLNTEPVARLSPKTLRS